MINNLLFELVGLSSVLELAVHQVICFGWMGQGDRLGGLLGQGLGVGLGPIFSNQKQEQGLGFGFGLRT